MGTNYYLARPPVYTSDILKPNPATLHIGKSSCGWKFLFQAHYVPSILTARDWRKHLQHGTIYDEYDKPISCVDFWAMVHKVNRRVNSSSHRLFWKGVDDLNRKRHWVDNQGYEFASSDFS